MALYNLNAARLIQSMSTSSSSSKKGFNGTLHPTLSVSMVSVTFKTALGKYCSNIPETVWLGCARKSHHQCPHSTNEMPEIFSATNRSRSLLMTGEGYSRSSHKNFL